MTGGTSAGLRVTYQEVDAVGILRMSDPDNSNVLTALMVAQMREAIAKAKARALLFCADGKNFCAGGDHTEFTQLTVDERRHLLSGTLALFTEVRRCEVPTVACMQGAVVGGGLELALQCDLLLASEDAKFGLPQVSLGIRIGQDTYDTLLTRAGLGATRRLVLLGETLGAATASSVGLVDFLTRRASLLDVGLSIARDLAAQPFESMGQARTAIASWVATRSFQ